MAFDGECEWLLEVDSSALDFNIAGGFDEMHSGSKQSHMTNLSTNYADDRDDMSTTFFKQDLNNAIDDFSKIVQTLALFKYYIRNRKVETNLDELHKRFNAFCVQCSNKVRTIKQHVTAVNRSNHEALSHREAMRYSYTDLKTRFTMQDASVNRLRTLMETYHSVVKEYTTAAKVIEEERNLAQRSDTTASVVAETANSEDMFKSNEAKLIDELKAKSQDILALEKNAKELNQLFTELNATIKKRGENIYKLEQEILLTSEQIDKGKADMASAYKAGSGYGVYWMCIVIATVTCLLLFPSQIKSAVFRTH
ncbi:putative integral membrane protein [Babesia bovis T2Bo]|uniref:t-SNARE coiled-coil homology domain-containing protein n=1 Tax=Babesia bovis TaxID=5865 RepID=A7AS87_BABBO|nr:putative integral membrane protein [Babesia bovis T2Bo]EDO07406.1 putative integral membrane protein [Babesia bovis T2Bo]|eukprot:XP_001610974.1 hypothetical protein [Babesia bovis T2Bo]